jgi:hypothetical protein
MIVRFIEQSHGLDHVARKQTEVNSFVDTPFKGANLGTNA